MYSWGDFITGLVVTVILGACITLAYFGIRQDIDQQCRDRKLVRIQAVRCPDKSPKLCPSAHFCGSCERHW